MRIVSLELIERNSQGAGSVNKSAVIAGERYDLSLFLEKVDRRQMKRIQSSDRPPEGLRALVSTGGESSTRATRLSRERTSSECDRVSLRA